MTSLALTFYSLLDIPIEDVMLCWQEAEASGFDYAVMSESAGRDAAVILAQAAVQTSTIKLGTNVIPMYVRSPMQTAAAALTLSEISGARFQILGLGTSYRKRVQAWFGAGFERPVTRAKEYIEIIRSLLSEGSTDYRGEHFNITNYPDLTLLTNASRDIRIYLGVTGPRMRRLTGEVADGVILNSLSTPAFIEQSIDLISEGAQKAGRPMSAIDIGCSIVFSASDDRQAAVDAAKRGLMFYIIYPEFDPIITTTDQLPQVQALRDAYWSGDIDEAYRLVTEDMLDAFVVYGTPAECREKLQVYVDAGVDLLVIRSCVDKLNGKDAVLQNIDALRGFLDRTELTGATRST
jgi:alkanesulfonate monooxygenase SsuD/methylene tetrahydromethanopterin reductase-like flavin-dependent oxidoreductase (luciferase family)